MIPVYADVLRAHARIAPRIHRTPVLTSRSLDALTGAELFFKAEHLQKIGAFKIRGATNLIAQLGPDELARGVVTHSSGNHAQATALAASWYGARATVVMPDNAPAVKRAATAGYGAAIETCRPTVADREAAVARIIAATGATLVHPYDDARIIAGQGTAALELLAEIDDLDFVLAPIGGGGLASGTAIACAAHPGRPRFVACEPAGADDARRSLASGVRVTEQTPRTCADGLRTTLGVLPFEVLAYHRATVHTVAEAEIVAAQRLLWERAKMLVEPSSAVAFAPVLARREDFAGRRVGVILSGGNVDASVYFAGLA